MLKVARPLALKVWAVLVAVAARFRVNVVPFGMVAIVAPFAFKVWAVAVAVAEEEGAGRQVLDEAAGRPDGDDAADAPGDELLEHDGGGRRTDAEAPDDGDPSTCLLEVGDLGAEVGFGLRHLLRRFDMYH